MKDRASTANSRSQQSGQKTSWKTRLVPTYRRHDTTGDDLGLIEHPAPNVEPGDVVMLDDGREALVTARFETDGGRFAALLEVAIAPTPLTSDESIT